MPGPDFTHGGTFIEWPDKAELDEHFPPYIDAARINPGMDVELVRWSPEDPIADSIHAWWVKQRTAIRRHLGATPGLKATVRARRHTEDGTMRGYVRFNRTRPAIVRDEVAS